MANLYNLDGIVTELRKRNAQDRAILAAWEAVTFPTKAAMTNKDFGGAMLYHAILDTVTARYPHC